MWLRGKSRRNRNIRVYSSTLTFTGIQHCVGRQYSAQAGTQQGVQQYTDIYRHTALCWQTVQCASRHAAECTAVH